MPILRYPYLPCREMRSGYCCFLHRKFIGSLVVVIGVILVFVGFEGLIGYDGFTLVSCGGPEPRFCIRVYSLDLLALLVGVVAAFVGTRVLVRDR